MRHLPGIVPWIYQQSARERAGNWGRMKEVKSSASDNCLGTQGVNNSRSEIDSGSELSNGLENRCEMMETTSVCESKTCNGPLCVCW
ncbi:hypothetical protein J6590_021571 [Homalodisca vitripennis]|nr:hypothetical protein J6590_021571 [Homalodisca vitripennis]